VCGNSVAEAPDEECDDGGTTPGDGCDAACQLESASPALCAGVPSTAGTALDAVLVADGFSSPVHVAAPRLDPNRIFVVEQGGTIRIVDNGVLLPAPFLDLGDDVPDTISCCGEQGLLALAFHPDYESNGFFYVSYTAPTSGPDGCANLGAGDNVLARFQVSGDPDVANEASKVELLRVPQPFTNHNGGNILFGPDGFLYMGIGDGGGGGDPCEAGQNSMTALGKLLRVDVTATPPIDPTTVIWASGLRNPWRFSFDRGTADLYVGDVGQNAWEEVSFVAAPVSAGVNYQWDDCEGRHDFEASCPTAGTPPVLEYCNFGNADPMCSSDPVAVPAHQAGCSVTGGYAYRGCAMPDIAGQYFYSDICSGFIRSFEGVSSGNAQSLADHTADVDPPGGLSIGGVSSFGEDARGELYIVDYGDGEVFKLVPGS
jgi:cysteine-rich repeat protein